MPKTILRPFDCPESAERCVDGRCKKDLCCEEQKNRVAHNNEAAARENRKFEARVLEIAKRIPQRNKK